MSILGLEGVFVVPLTVALRDWADVRIWRVLVMKARSSSGDI
jgi:predicted alpha/beta-fold hydrolase